jgi:hypothetical protein
MMAVGDAFMDKLHWISSAARRKEKAITKRVRQPEHNGIALRMVNWVDG